jgi:hypothetical protein
VTGPTTARILPSCASALCSLAVMATSLESEIGGLTRIGQSSGSKTLPHQVVTCLLIFELIRRRRTTLLNFESVPVCPHVSQILKHILLLAGCSRLVRNL